MAYVVKYIMQVRSDRGNDIRIEILQRDYEGEVISKSLGGAPLLTIDQGDGAIKGSSLTFAIQADVEGELQELYTTDNKLFKVNLYKNDIVTWQGYVLPELYSENYVDPPYDVTVTATDGLATLKAVPYEGADVSVTIATIISDILGRTQMTMPIVYHMQMAHMFAKVSGDELNTGMQPIPMLVNTYISQAAYNGYSCYDVLNQILQSCNCCIMQMGGEWLISSLTDSSDIYYSAGVSSARAHKILGQLGAAEVYPSGSLTMVNSPAYKGVNVEYSHMLKNSFLNNADCVNRKEWNYTPDSRNPIDIPGEREAFGKIFKAYCWELHPNNIQNDNSLQLWQDVVLAVDIDNIYNLSFKSLFATNAKLLLLSITHIGDDGINRQLTGEGWVTQWNKSDVNSYIQITGQNKGGGLQSISNIEEYEDTLVQFHLPEISGSLRIGFINSTKDYAEPLASAPIYVTQVYLTVGSVTGQQCTTLVEPNATQEQPGVLLVYGDTFASTNAVQLELNTLKNASGQNISSWWLNGQQYASYYDMMLQEYSRYFGVKKMQLQGVLMGQEVLHNIYFDTHSEKTLRLLTASVDLLSEEASVTLEEIVDALVEFDAVVEAAFNNNQFGSTTGGGMSSSGGSGSGSSGGEGGGGAAGEVTAQSIVDALGYIPYDSRNPNKYITSAALEPYVLSDSLAAIVTRIDRDIANRALTEDLKKLEESVTDIAGYFINGSANNALKLGGQQPEYYATASGLTSANTKITNLTTRVGTAEGNITTLQGYFTSGKAKFAIKDKNGNDIVDTYATQTVVNTLSTKLSSLTGRVDVAEDTIKSHTDSIALNMANITANANAITAIDNRVDALEALGFVLKDGYIYTEKTIVSKGEIISGRRASGASTDVGGGGISSITAQMIADALGYVPYSSANPAGYITNSALKGYAKLTDIPSLSGYATETWVTNKGYITSAALNGYATQAWVEGKKYLTAIPSEYITETELSNTLGGYQTKITSSNKLAYSLISGTPTLATVATSGKYSDLSGTPSSLPASDVYAWAKAATKPTYTASEVGALSTGGGTISGSSSTILTINRTEGTPYVCFNKDGSLLGFLGIRTGGYPVFVDSGGVSFQMLHSGNYSGYALPLSGVASQLDYTSSNPLLVNTTASSNMLTLKIGGVSYTQVGYYNGLGSILYSAIADKYLGIKDDGTPTYNGNTLIHSGNIGSYNAGSATKLQTARTIWGQSFDGTADVSGILRLYDSNGYHANILGNTTGITLDTWRDDVGYFPIKLAPNGGNVLIGTTTDNGYKLDVNGASKVRGKAAFGHTILADRYNGQGNTAGAAIIVNKGGNYFGIGASAIKISNLSLGWVSDLEGTWNQELITITEGTNRVGIKTTTPAYALDVNGSLGAGSTTLSSLTVNGDTHIGGNLTATGEVISSRRASSSDARLKDNINRLIAEDCLAMVRNLQPSSWDWKENGEHSLGFIAQDIEPLMPYAVTKIKDEVLGQRLNLQYDQFFAPIVGAIQCLDIKVNSHEDEIERLKKRVKYLENKLQEYGYNRY